MKKKRFFTIFEAELGKTHLFETDCPAVELDGVMEDAFSVAQNMLENPQDVNESVYNIIRLSIYAQLQSRNYNADEIALAKSVMYSIAQPQPEDANA